MIAGPPMVTTELPLKLFARGKVRDTYELGDDKLLMVATDRISAINFLLHHDAKGEVVTGLLYLDSNPEDLHAHLNTVEVPFNKLGEKELCPGAGMLEKINASLR